MAVQFKIPPSPDEKIYNVKSFGGVDLSSAPVKVDKLRSPDSLNTMPDMNGNPVKRPGYFLRKTYPDRINGVFYLSLPNATHEIVHAGAKIYLCLDNDDYTKDTLLYSDANDARSTAYQMMSKLLIADGKKLLLFDGTSIVTAESVATIPTITISRAPTGGGTSLNPINLLQPGRHETFLGTANTTVYQLSFGTLDATAVTARKMTSEGAWANLSEGTDFTVNRTTAAVTFLTAPGASPVAGVDNVEITYYKTAAGNADKVNKSAIMMLYGLNGAMDRAFLSGNPDFPNYDWYSQQNDPSYFGDAWYSILGQDGAKVVGYTVVADRLVAIKDRAENGRNAIIRQGTLVDGKAQFLLAGVLQGEGAIAPKSFGYLSTEPLFLTRNGVFAITSQDITGEKYLQNRSFYVNRRLISEPNMQDAVSTVWGRFYVLALNGKVYLLDSEQAVYERDEPMSRFQYECYYWDNVPARVIWSRDDKLYFGTDSGGLFEFHPRDTEANHYNDNGAAINTYWDFPDFYGDNFFLNKTIKYISVMVAPAPVTSVRIMARRDGVWSVLFEEDKKTRYFVWSKLTWSKFTWSSNTNPRTVGMKYKIRKFDGVRLRIQNNVLNEPFGIFEVSWKYVESGIYKR